MRLEYIKEFVVLAEENNYSEAANKLSISQTALSQHIKKLEEDLGKDLFIMLKHKTVLTPFGHFFLTYASSISNTYDEFLTDSKLLFDPVLRIGAIHTLRSYHIDQFITDFIHENASIDFSMEEGSTSSMITWVENGQCDAAFITTSGYRNERLSLPDDFRILPLYQDKLAVMLSPSHPLCSQEIISLEDLKNETFLWCTKSLTTASSHFTPHLVYTGAMVNVASLMRSNSSYVAILHRQEAFRQAASANLAVRELTPVSPKMLCLVYRKENNKPSLKKFIQFTKKNFETRCVSKYIP